MPAAAKESKKVAKVRNKLKKVMAEEKRHYTSEALQEMTKTIHQWINRHQNERISIKEKSFRLFDENQTPAEIQSPYVQELFQKLSSEARKIEQKSQLKGRIKSDSN